MHGPTRCCLACGQEESPEHLYQCPQRKALNEQLINNIKQTLAKEGTPTELILELISNIRDEIEIKPTAERLSAHQCHGQLGAKLTWHDFLVGRIDRGYGEIMDKIYKDDNDKKHDSTTWTTALLVCIWKGMYAIWKSRCDKQHQSDKDTVGSYARMDAQAVAKAMYSMQDQMRQFDRDAFFSIPLETLLEKPTRSITEWIQTVKPILKKLRQDARRIDTTVNTRRIRDLRDYFQCRRPP